MKQDINTRKSSIYHENATTMPLSRRLLNKVPEVTIFFWIIKLLATTLAVVLISIVGTLITDNLVDNFGVPLETTTIIFAIALTVTFSVWYANEKTLSIHSIFTTKREGFYWSAILFTFALGTAAGDLVSEGLNLGYLTSAIIFAGLIGVIAIAHFRFKLNTVFSFWIAYILTRPLGASLGDYLSQPHDEGGLNLGTVGTSALFLIIILSIVIYLTMTKRDKATISALETAGDI